MTERDQPAAAYPPIADYAFLSDSHTAALIGPDGAIEWLCAPRFDGPSVFARLLDREQGGAFTLEVESAGPPARRYVDGSLVVETRYSSPQATVEVLDFLSLEAEGHHGLGEVDPHHVLIRLVRCEQGTARVRARIDARPDWPSASVALLPTLRNRTRWAEGATFRVDMSPTPRASAVSKLPLVKFMLASATVC